MEAKNLGTRPKLAGAMGKALQARGYPGANPDPESDPPTGRA